MRPRETFTRNVMFLWMALGRSFRPKEQLLKIFEFKNKYQKYHPFITPKRFFLLFVVPDFFSFLGFFFLAVLLQTNPVFHGKNNSTREKSGKLQRHKPYSGNLSARNEKPVFDYARISLRKWSFWTLIDYKKIGWKTKNSSGKTLSAAKKQYMDPCNQFELGPEYARSAKK